MQVADFLVLLHKIDEFPNPVFKIDGFPDPLLKINGFLGTQEPMLTRPLFSILVMNMISIRLVPRYQFSCQKCLNLRSLTNVCYCQVVHYLASHYQQVRLHLIKFSEYKI